MSPQLGRRLMHSGETNGTPSLPKGNAMLSIELSLWNTDTGCVSTVYTLSPELHYVYITHGVRLSGGPKKKKNEESIGYTSLVEEVIN